VSTIAPARFFDWLTARGVNFFTGVPDSLLKHFCAYVDDNAGERHVIAANEGAAVALACGYHLATGGVALVYMQNSGQGNTINPLLSLADAEVYGIPLLMLVGWRAGPGVKDEPQHVKQGKVTLELFETMGIPTRVMPREAAAAEACIGELLELARTSSAPVALVVEKGSFEAYKAQPRDDEPALELTRERAVECVAECLSDEDVIVSTTGKCSRELYEYRMRTGGTRGQEFLTVGSMGHASQIAMGIALARPERHVFCIDGDGALIMHLGSAAIIGTRAGANFKHVVLNNGAHESVGGQPTAGFHISIPGIAEACGYRRTLRAESEEQLREALQELSTTDGPALLEIRVRKGARDDLGRPRSTPQENKAAFMKFLAR
jgi:phosphonopyruvate decarboxylase